MQKDCHFTFYYSTRLKCSCAVSLLSLVCTFATHHTAPNGGTCKDGSPGGTQTKTFSTYYSALTVCCVSMVSELMIRIVWVGSGSEGGGLDQTVTGQLYLKVGQFLYMFQLRKIFCLLYDCLLSCR